MTDEQMYEGFKIGDNTALTYIYQVLGSKVLGIAITNSGSEDDGYDLLQATMVVIWQQLENGRYEHKGKFRQYFFGVAYKLWLNELRKRKKNATVPIDNLAMVLAIPALGVGLDDDCDTDESESSTEGDELKIPTEINNKIEEIKPQNTVNDIVNTEKNNKKAKNVKSNKKGEDDDIDIFNVVKDSELAKLHKALKIITEDCRVKLTLFHFDKMPTKQIAELLETSDSYIRKRLHICRKKLGKIAEKF